MHPRSFDKIDESNFSLDPILTAVKNEDREAMLAYFEQGYCPSWQDHSTHKTLLFTLGEQLDIKAIRFVQSLFEYGLSLNDAVEGAAFANHRLLAIEELGEFERYFPAALIGAARGMHIQLVNEIKNKRELASRQFRSKITESVIRGAALANDQSVLVNRYVNYFDRGDQDALFAIQLLAAAQGGHADEVEKILNLHDSLPNGLIKNDSGYHVAYKTAVRGAAIAGNIGLVAKILLKMDSGWKSESSADVARFAIETAAYHGHDDLVLDLISRVKIDTNHPAHLLSFIDPCRVMVSALRGALTTNRFKLAAKIFAHGATAQDVIDAIKGSDTSSDIRKSFRTKIINLIKTLNNPLLCYEIAYLYDKEYSNLKDDLIIEVTKMFGLPEVNYQTRNVLFSNRGIDIWFANHDKLHFNTAAGVQPVNHDAAIVVASFVTGRLATDESLRACRQLAIALDAATKATHQTPEISPSQLVANTIRKRLLQEIDKYLKTSLKGHADRAKALYTCVHKLHSMESIYLIIQHQITLMHGKNGKDNLRVPINSALRKLARMPQDTGHSLFSYVFNRVNSPDYLTMVENCLKIFAEYKHDPEISRIMADKDLYESPLRRLP